MKGGQKPIHIQRWAPADYVNDPFVKLLVFRKDFQTLSFYHLVINWSFIEGGDLPSDPEALAAILGMSAKDVEKSLAVCLAAGKLFVEDTCLFNKRVWAEVAGELVYRAEQVALGTRGGKAAGKGRPLTRPTKSHRGTPMDNVCLPIGPPSPLPAPAPVPVTTDPVASAPDPAPPEVEIEETTAPGGTAVPLVAPSWNREAAELWWLEYKGNPPKAFFAALKSLVKREGWERVRPALVTYMAETPADYVNIAGKFVAAFGTWESRARGQPSKRGASVPEKNAAVLDEWAQEVREGKR